MAWYEEQGLQGADPALVIEKLRDRCAELEQKLAERANMTPEQVVQLCVRERAKERKRWLQAIRALGEE